MTDLVSHHKVVNAPVRAPVHETRACDDHIFTVGHDPRLLKLESKDAKTLLIQYPNDSRRANEFRCLSEWNDIQIECPAYTPDYSKPVGEMPPAKRWLW
jgi:hypothetical protein